MHGAWHGAWCWEHVISLLDDAAVPSIAIDLPGHGASTAPLSDLAGDAAALRTVLDSLDNAIVCGHSYGGAVISEGAADHTAVRHLVVIAGFPLAVGESCATVGADELAPEDTRTALGAALVSHDDGTSTIDPERAIDLFYDDCAPDDAAKAVDRLDAQSWAELGGVATRAAWPEIPSTYAVCTEDHAVSPALQQVLARRCTHTLEWSTSHSPFVSRPELVANLLIELASTTIAPAPTPATRETEHSMTSDTNQSEYRERAHSALDKLKAQIDELRVQADLAQAEVRDRLTPGIESLRKRQGEALAKLDDAQKAGGEAWKSVAQQAEQVVSELGDTFSKVATEMQSAAGAAGAAAAKGRDAFLDEWRKEREARHKLLDK